MLIVVGAALSFDLLLPLVPERYEQKLSHFTSDFVRERRAKEIHPAELQVQALADGLLKASDLTNWKIPVIVVESGDAENAVTFPGGLVVLLSGVLKNSKYENEVAMILGHEIGHVVKRHVVRRVGRDMLFSILSGYFFSDLTELESILDPAALLGHRAFDREQEKEADEVGLALVHAYYGHVGGTLGFFERVLEQEKKEKQLTSHYLSTHPFIQARIDRLQRLAAERGYVWGEPKELRLTEMSSSQ